MLGGTGKATAVVLAVLTLLAGTALALRRPNPGFGPSGYAVTSLTPGADRRPAAPNIWDLASTRHGFAAALADLTGELDYFGVAVYRRDGSLDRRFADGGFSRELPLRAGHAQAQAVAVQRDGRIVLAGWLRRNGVQTLPLLARFGPRGGLDRSFGGDGIVDERRPGGGGSEVLHDVAVDGRGRIVGVGAIGEHGIGESGFRPAGLVIAYRPDGSLDRSFGDEGHVAFPAKGGGEYTGLQAVRVLGDGRILVAGFHFGSLFLARLTPGGAPDPSFGGGDGEVEMFLGDRHGGCDETCYSATPLTVDPRGRILVAGATFPDVPVLVRLLPDGTLDRSFGSHGIVRVRFAGHWFRPFGLALQKGRVLLGGWDERRHGDAVVSFSAARYRADGTPDRSFGKSGLLVRSTWEYSGAFAALEQPHGRVVIAGGAEDEGREKGYESYLVLRRDPPR